MHSDFTPRLWTFGGHLFVQMSTHVRHVSAATFRIIALISFINFAFAALSIPAPTSFPTTSPKVYVIGDEEMTFEDAEDWCIALGSNLVSIHSDAEMSVVTSICSEDCWIGAHCMDNGDGEFEYTDGNVWGNYTNWYYSGPSTCIHDHCVYLYSEGLWRDISCDSYNYPLCNPVGPTSGHYQSDNTLHNIYRLQIALSFLHSISLCDYNPYYKS